MPAVDVVRTYLELRSPDQLRRAPAPSSSDSVTVAQERPCSAATYRALYAAVGEAYAWRDRLSWSDEQLATYLCRDEVSVWVLQVQGEVAGYFELVCGENGDVEIGYFGLLRRYHGRGLGKFLLTRAVDEAWVRGASRVWLHTCTLDDPAALPNYLARGFTPFGTDRYVAQLPD